MLHFKIQVLKTGGAFGATSNCTAGAFLADFPGATIAVGDGSTVDSAFCSISDSTPSVDRNNSGAGGGHSDNDDHGPVFSETGGSAVPIAHGVLSAMGTAMFGNYSYHLSDIDKMVFGYTAGTGAGLNARLIYVEDTNDWSSITSNNMNNYSYSARTYYTLGITNGATTKTALTVPATACNSSPCRPDSESSYSFNGLTWADNQTAATQAMSTAIGASSWVGSVFYGQFGGPIPTQAQLTDQMANGKTHRDNNPTGQSKFQVIYDKQPDWNNPNCQWSSTSVATAYPLPSAALSNYQTKTGTTDTTTTQCTAQDGTPSPAVTVNLAFTTLGASGSETASHIKAITLPTTGTTGKYYLFPVSYNGQFTGLIQFLNVKTGSILLDESMNPRYVQVILNTTTQCNHNGLPTTGSGCAQGKVYNTSATWTCSGMCTVSTSASADQIAVLVNDSGNLPSGTTAMPTDVHYRSNQIWTGSGPSKVGVAPASNNNGPSSYKALQLTVDTDGAVLTATAQTTISGAGNYAVYQNYTCSGNSCSQDGYYLADANGANPYTNSGSLASGLTAATIQGTSNVVKYTDSYFQGLGSSAFPYADTGTTSWQTAAQQVEVSMGPAINTTFDCSKDPFYLGTNNDNGSLPYTVNSTTGAVTCTTPTFGSTWEVANYILGGNGQTAHASAAQNIRVNYKNAYEYGDPKAVTALIQAAFGPWLDGKHTLTANTNLNAMQVFGLVYVFMNSKEYHPNNILPGSNGKYLVQSPLFGDGGSADVINTGFAQSFLNNKQATAVGNAQTANQSSN